MSKCTYQERYQITEILVRVDLDGPPHQNPDGEVLAGPHIHIYREGFGTKWATPLSESDFPHSEDLIQTFKDFLRYCHVGSIPEIQGGLQ